LLTNFTQNIDNIEANAGVLPEKIVQCHGSFATATCTVCGHKVPGEEIFDTIREGKVPECEVCKERIALKSQGMKRKRSSNGVQKSRKRDEREESLEEEQYEIPAPGVMKVSEELHVKFWSRFSNIKGNSQILPFSAKTFPTNLVVA